MTTFVICHLATLFKWHVHFTDPRHCSVNDPLKSTCFLNAVNTDGFYEGSPITVSFVYSFTDISVVIRVASAVFPSAQIYLFALYFARWLNVWVQYVPQDTAKLVELQGGAQKFIDRLNFIFADVSQFHCAYGEILHTV